MKERSKGEKATEIHTHPSTHPQNLKKKKIFYPTQLLLCYYGNSTGLGSLRVSSELGLYVLDWHL